MDIARELLDSHLTDDSEFHVEAEEHLGVRALDVMLLMRPEEVWGRFKAAYSRLGTNVLESLKIFQISPAENYYSASFESWDTLRLVDLVEILLKEYPREEPSSEEIRITPAFELRSLQSQLLDLLFQQGRASADHLNRLASEYSHVGAWLSFRRANLEQRALLGAEAEGGKDSLADWPEPQEVVAVLENTDYRLVRNGQDLLDVVEEELGTIADSIENDLDLFYSLAQKGDEPRRRHERVLQAYVRTRLSDRLSRRLLFDRECQVKLKRRTDIRVVASTGTSERPAVVVIEIKWSSSKGPRRGVSTGLSAQLGTDYLLKEDEKYGVFLVGWDGKLGDWQDNSVARPEETAEGLLSSLQGQADDFNDKNPGLDVRAVVLDLEWRRA